MIYQQEHTHAPHMCVFAGSALVCVALEIIKGATSAENVVFIRRNSTTVESQLCCLSIVNLPESLKSLSLKDFNQCQQSHLITAKETTV